MTYKLRCCVLALCLKQDNGAVHVVLNVARAEKRTLKAGGDARAAVNSCKTSEEAGMAAAVASSLFSNTCKEG